jgi:hypothetical protein
MNALRVYVEGVGLWSPRLAGFEALRGQLAGREPPPPPARPPAVLLAPNERRRAPENVLLAVEAAGQAVAMSGRDAATLASVFASGQGDQPLTDAMCATLAHAPHELSPTRFHNSVHNAAAGYWTIATGCHAASGAVCAGPASFGAGLLEAAALALADGAPVLLACSDTAGSGPLREVTGCEEAFACALVLAPSASDRSLARLDLALTPARSNVVPTEESAPKPVAGNPSAAALPLLGMLAGNGGRCLLEAAGHLCLQIDTEPRT